MKTFFISSTFKDMHAERDALHQAVFPALRKLAKPYGEEIDALDLRWGVDTSLMTEAQSGMHVIETCMDAIDRCRPYMVVLIGERYGWIPEEGLISELHDARMERWGGVPMSITQMEILYGALESDALERCVFCFRDAHFSDSLPEAVRGAYAAESDEHRKKLSALKEKIKATPGAKIMEYSLSWDEARKCVTGTEQFIQKLTALLGEMLKAELCEAEELCFEERIIKDAVLTAQRHMASYVERSKLSGGASVLNGRSGTWFYGEGGCGKSAYLSSVFRGHMRAGVSSFIYYCGNENCASADVFIDTLLFWLNAREGRRESLQGSELTRVQKLKQILELLKKPRSRNSVILVDAVDQMEENITDILTMLGKAVFRDPVEEYTFGMAVTSTDDYYAENKAKLEINDFSGRQIGGLEPAEAVSLAQKHAAKRGKHISPEVIEQIRTNPCYTNPYYLSLALQEIFMLSAADFKAAEAMAPGMQGLTLYMNKIFLDNPADIREMTLHMLDFTVARFESRFSDMAHLATAAPKFIFQLLAVSKNGLTIAELSALAQLEGKTLLPMAVQSLFSFMYDALSENSDGRWSFSHRLLREGLLEDMQSGQQCMLSKLLHIYYKQAGNVHESFYYALRSGDRACVAAAINETFAEETESEYLAMFGDYLVQTGLSAATEFVHADAERYAHLAARAVLSDTDKAIQSYAFWYTLFDGVISKAAVSETTLFYLLAAKAALLRYSDDKDSRADCFDAMLRLYEGGVQGVEQTLFEAMLYMLCYEVGVADADRIDRCLALLTARVQAGETERDFTDLFSWVKTDMGQLTVFWRLAQTQKAQERIETLTNLRIAVFAALKKLQLKNWECMSRLESLVYMMLYRQMCYIAQLLNNSGKFSLAGEVLEESASYYEARIRFFPSADERAGYVEWLFGKIDNIKAEYVQAYIEKLRAQLEALHAAAPLPYFERLLGHTYYLETDNLRRLKRAGKADASYKEKLLLAYKKGIRIYEKLAQERNCEVQYDKTLDMLSNLRYQRVLARQEMDIWNWKDDLPSLYYKKGEKRRAELMEEDLERLIACASELYEKEKSLQRLYELVWGYDAGVRYYSFRQMGEKANAWAKSLLACLEKIIAQAPTGGNCTKGDLYLTLAQCAQRFGSKEKADEFAQAALSYYQMLSKEWIEKNNYVRRMTDVKVHALLVQLCVCDNTDKALALFAQAEAELTKLGEEKEDRQTRADLMRMLYTALGFVYYNSGETVRAAEAFSSAAQNSSTPIASLYMSTKEEELIDITYYLEGQTVRAFLTEEKALADACLKRFAIIVESNTTEENSAMRPLLLVRMQEFAEMYQRVFAGEPLCAPLHYILMETKAARQKEKYEKQLPVVREKRAAFETWEAEKGDIAAQAYCDLLKAYGESLSVLAEHCEKGSEEYNAVFIEIMRLRKKLAQHYWAAENVRYAVWFERDFAQQFEFKPELMEGAFSTEETYAYWLNLKPRLLDAPYINRNAEADIANLQEFGVSACVRMYAHTNDLQYLEAAVSDILAYRAYLENRFGVNKEDDAWFKEVHHGFYTQEQKIYLEMQADGRVEEQAWLSRLLCSLEAQLRIVLFLPPSFYPEKLDMLFALQNSDVSDRLAVQRAIDMVQTAQSGKDIDTGYYLSSAVRALGADASVEEVEAYIQKIQEKNGQ